MESIDAYSVNLNMPVEFPFISTLMPVTGNHVIFMVVRQAQALVQVLQQSIATNMAPAEIAANLKQLGGILTQLLEFHRDRLPEWTSLDQLPKVWLPSTSVAPSTFSC